MSRARSKNLPADSTAASLSPEPSVFGSSYKRQKIIVTAQFPVSGHDSDNEPVHPFHLPSAARLSPKRQILQAKVRRLKREEQRDEATQEKGKEEAEEVEEEVGETMCERSSQQQTWKDSQPAASAKTATHRSTHTQTAAPIRPKVQQGVSGQQHSQSRATADGGRYSQSQMTASHAHLSPPPAATTTASRYREPSTYSATMRADSRNRSLSPLSDSPLTSPTSSSSSSPLSPQRLLSEWVDRRIAIKQKSDRKDEQRWKTAVQRQLAQLLQQTTVQQRAGWSKGESESREERTRVERVEQLEERLERLVGSWEAAQQQRTTDSDKRRRAVQRALQLSGSGGRSDIRRTLVFAKREKEEKYGGVGDKAARVDEVEVGEAIQDGCVRNEYQLIWLLQQPDVRV